MEKKEPLMAKAEDLINIILKLTVKTMRKEKKQTAVARSKFIDRIKSTVDFELEHKQNVNLNDIRQSGYKLPRSKSNTRYDHSLERKQPIKISKDTLNNSIEHNSSEITLKNTMKQYTSEAPTGNNTIKLDACHNASFTESKEARSPHKQQHERIETPNNAELREEEEVLDIIKIIWECTIKMKEKCIFKEEMIRIQNILKDVIIVMAKPKFNSIQESSNLSLKAPELRFSPFQHLQSFKDSKTSSKESSINYFPSHNKKQQQAMYKNSIYESEAEDDLQFKKIMYILEQKSKTTKNIPEYSSSNCNEGRELRELSDILNIKTSCYSSSFDCSSRQLSGHTVREFEKVNNSRSNEKVFLKNIVKKAKTSISNLEEAEILNFDKKSKSELSCYHEVEQIGNETISQEEQDQQSVLEHIPIHEPQEQIEQEPTQEKYLPKTSKADHIKIETMETLEDESQSKRAVLNQIIAMLNNKYHKNIKLEPRRH